MIALSFYHWWVGWVGVWGRQAGDDDDDEEEDDEDEDLRQSFVTFSVYFDDFS